MIIQIHYATCTLLVLLPSLYSVALICGNYNIFMTMGGNGFFTTFLDPQPAIFSFEPSFLQREYVFEILFSMIWSHIPYYSIILLDFWFRPGDTRTPGLALCPCILLFGFSSSIYDALAVSNFSFVSFIAMD